ncbi:MAG: hypothetical protein LBP19_09605 [Treponema sp.]|nr:hypothetical protein [Treponema sp.]
MNARAMNPYQHRRSLLRMTGRKTYLDPGIHTHILRTACFIGRIPVTTGHMYDSVVRKEREG